MSELDFLEGLDSYNTGIEFEGINFELEGKVLTLQSEILELKGEVQNLKAQNESSLNLTKALASALVAHSVIQSADIERFMTASRTAAAPSSLHSASPRAQVHSNGFQQISRAFPPSSSSSPEKRPASLEFPSNPRAMKSISLSASAPSVASASVRPEEIAQVLLLPVETIKVMAKNFVEDDHPDIRFQLNEKKRQLKQVLAGVEGAAAVVSTFTSIDTKLQMAGAIKILYTALNRRKETPLPLPAEYEDRVAAIKHYKDKKIPAVAALLGPVVASSGEVGADVNNPLAEGRQPPALVAPAPLPAPAPAPAPTQEVPTQHAQDQDQDQDQDQEQQDDEDTNYEVVGAGSTRPASPSATRPVPFALVTAVTTPAPVVAPKVFDIDLLRTAGLLSFSFVDPRLPQHILTSCLQQSSASKLSPPGVKTLARLKGPEKEKDLFIVALAVQNLALMDLPAALKKPLPLYSFYAFYFERSINFAVATDRVRSLLIREGLHTKGSEALGLLNDTHFKKSNLLLELAVSLVKRVIPDASLEASVLEKKIELIETWKSAGMAASLLHLVLSAKVFPHLPHLQPLIDVKDMLENSIFKIGHGIMFPELPGGADKKVLDAEKKCLF